MSEKTTQELEQQKLKIEIELLEHNLKKEKKAGKRTRNLGEIIRKNIALILAIFSVVGGFIGIIIPINQYFEEKKKAMLPTLNNDIINLVKNLNDSIEIVQEEAAVMLTYYGIDAIPILLLKLELSKSPDTERLIDAIKNIHNEEPLAVMDEIIDAFKSEVEKNYDEDNLDVMGYDTKIFNYVELLTNLELSRREKYRLRNLFDEFEEHLIIDTRENFPKTFLLDLNFLCNHLQIDSVKIDK